MKGVTLGMPAAETVSYITIVPDKKEYTSTQVSDPVMITELLEIYTDDNV